MTQDAVFRRTVLAHWRRHGRHELPWRKTSDPYAILVSELMLQQTQVDRVIPFYRKFLKRFPSFRTLARARTANLLAAWQGLGYNRRALLLRACADAVTARHGGHLPRTYDTLVALPGIGPYTAGAVMAFAFDLPHPLIETNIRRAYLHHFFRGARDVPDAAVLDLVRAHLARTRSPRIWFSALMDYGSMLADRLPKDANPNRRSRAYVRQSRFAGSDRQVRGAILRHALAGGGVALRTLSAKLDVDASRVARIAAGLEREGFIAVRRGRVAVSGR
ncbi:MAG TPA: A/G-specific adenine glycosylase [Candidatus Paceibacterota bacterium]|nr:A/G-specific adenine glycosylase [Candidatus Paceibacterota bacterium]